MRRRLRTAARPAVKTLAVLLVLLVIAVGARHMSFLDQMMVYFPERELSTTPANVGLAFEDVSLTAADGTKLHGWHVPGESRTTLLWLHGNAGNISHRVDNIAMLVRHTGLGVFIIDYRGYGRSEGKPTEKGLYMDAEAAFEHMTVDARPGPRGETSCCSVAPWASAWQWRWRRGAESGVWWWSRGSRRCGRCRSPAVWVRCRFCFSR